MSIGNLSTDTTLDPVTGIPLDASYATQYQVPLGSQPINLDELNAQGKQGNWLYPDNLPPVVARLQARDLTNPGNAQDLSTDGERNLNVDINKINPAISLGGGNAPVPIHAMQLSQSTAGFGENDLGPIGALGSVIYGLSFSWTYDAGSIRSDNHNGFVRLYIPGQSVANDSLILASIAISIPASGTTDRIAGEVHEWFDRGMIFPYALDQGDGQYHLWLSETNIGGGDMSLGVWMGV